MKFDKIYEMLQVKKKTNTPPAESGQEKLLGVDEVNSSSNLYILDFFIFVT